MGGDIPEKPRLCASLVTFSPSGCGCALPRWELWSLLGHFAGIGRVVLSREDENGAYAWNQEGGNVAPVGVVAWLYAWKLWVRGIGCLLCRGWLGKSTPGFSNRLCRGVARSLGFIRVGAMGIRIWKTTLRFPNFLGGRKNLSRGIHIGRSFPNMNGLFYFAEQLIFASQDDFITRQSILFLTVQRGNPQLF